MTGGVCSKGLLVTFSDSMFIFRGVQAMSSPNEKSLRRSTRSKTERAKRKVPNQEVSRADMYERTMNRK